MQGTRCWSAGWSRDDLDVSVKASPCAADKPDSCIRGQDVFYPLKTGWMADFPGKPHGWTPRCFINQEEREIARELSN